MLFQSNTLFKLKVTRQSTKNATIIIIAFVRTLCSDLLKSNYNVSLASLNSEGGPSDEFATSIVIHIELLSTAIYIVCKIFLKEYEIPIKGTFLFLVLNLNFEKWAKSV